ncbi:MAG TPA: thioredoxin domain-containing protein [Clostridia bacterium]|nr:thioredoxin domain-containing protein [Clostridia bacterium]
MMKNKFTALLLSLLLLASCTLAVAADTSSLRPPKGAKVAIIVFEDVQCPDCARAEPLLQEAVKTYKIPLIRHDFPLPMHNWSFEAHVMARYFDIKSKALGEEFRSFLLENQRSVTPLNLRGIADRWAAEHKTTLPFVYDPKGELAAKVKADFALGQRVGVEHTPTIYVVSNTQRGTPFVEVVDRSQLFQLIDKMLREAAPVATKATKPARSTKTTAKP